MTARSMDLIGTCGSHAYSSWASPAPAVMAISPMGANSTSTSSVQFIVTFSQGVTDVDAGDFALACLGTSGTIASVVDCSQCHAVYIVTVDNVSGNGTLGLNLIDNNSIKDTNNVPLVGIGTDDGSFTGDVYTASSPFVWDGGGADNHWSTAANWAGDVAPQAGDNLRFVGTASTNTENDFTAGTLFGSIEFASSGFELTGNSLTLTNGISVDAGVSTATISTDAVALGGPVTINVADANASLTISGNISGSNNLAKTGTGTLLLAGANTYTGTTTINAGILQAKKTVVLPGYNIAGKVVVNDGGTISVNAGGTGEWQPADIQALHTNATFNGHSALGIDTTYATTPFTYPNAISRAWGFTKLGSNTLILTANNTYNGVTTISGGTLQINNGGTLGAGDITNSGTLAFNHTDGVTVSKVISGIGSLVQQGTGTLRLTGANTYTGARRLTPARCRWVMATITTAATTLRHHGTLGTGNVLVNPAVRWRFPKHQQWRHLVVGNAISGTGALNQIG